MRRTNGWGVMKPLENGRTVLKNGAKRMARDHKHPRIEEAVRAEIRAEQDAMRARALEAQILRIRAHQDYRDPDPHRIDR